MLYGPEGYLKRIKAYSTDNGPDECVRRHVRRWLAAEEMAGGPNLDQDILLSHVELTSLASGDSDQNAVERVNACGSAALSSLCLDTFQYQKKFGNCYNDETGAVDEEKKVAMQRQLRPLSFVKWGVGARKAQLF